MADCNQPLKAECFELLETATQDFDWDALYAHLDADAREDGNDKNPVEVVTRLLEMFLPAPGQPVIPSRIGLRVIALAWVLNPAYFEGDPSMSELAARCGVRLPTLAKRTGHFSRVIRWRNHWQRHSWNWAKGAKEPPEGAKPKGGA